MEPTQKQASRENELEESRMPLWQHLDELRQGLIRSIIAVMLGLSVTYYFSDKIVGVLERPLFKLLPEENNFLYFTGIADKFFVYLKVSVIASVFLVSPYIFYEIWKFVAPALYKHERKFVLPFILFATLTFIMGLSFSYFVVIPFGYKFLIEFGSPKEKAMITITEYFNLTTKLMLAIGLVFELPVILVLLGKFGIIDTKFLSKNRRFAILLSAIVAAVATPSPDAFTMILVMVPLYLLYEVSIVAVRMTAPRKKE